MNYKEQLEKINQDLFNYLQEGEYGFSPDLSVRVEERSVELSVKDLSKRRNTLFASDVTVYITNGFKREVEPRLSVGSAGSFTPNNKASYWRTIHAALILKHWDDIIPVMVKASEDVFDLYNEIY